MHRPLREPYRPCGLFPVPRPSPPPLWSRRRSDVDATGIARRAFGAPGSVFIDCHLAQHLLGLLRLAEIVLACCADTLDADNIDAIGFENVRQACGIAIPVSLRNLL